jgi:hypothetical protein
VYDSNSAGASGYQQAHASDASSNRLSNASRKPGQPPAKYGGKGKPDDMSLVHCSEITNGLHVGQLEPQPELLFCGPRVRVALHTGNPKFNLRTTSGRYVTVP